MYNLGHYEVSLRKSIPMVSSIVRKSIEGKQKGQGSEFSGVRGLRGSQRVVFLMLLGIRGTPAGCVRLKFMKPRSTDFHR